MDNLDKFIENNKVPEEEEEEEKTKDVFFTFKNSGDRVYGKLIDIETVDKNKIYTVEVPNGKTKFYGNEILNKRIKKEFLNKEIAVRYESEGKYTIAVK